MLFLVLLDSLWFLSVSQDFLVSIPFWFLGFLHVPLGFLGSFDFLGSLIVPFVDIWFLVIHSVFWLS